MSIEITAVEILTEACLTIRRDDDEHVKFIVQNEKGEGSAVFTLDEGRRISATLATLLTGP